MNRDKQIEEMARIICSSHNNNACVFNHEPCDFKCSAYGNANNLYNAGYRKADEVAREIFEEIEEMLNLQAKIVCQTRGTVMKADEPPLSYMAMLDGRIYSIRVVEEHIAELKKKYTESEDTE